MASEKKSEVKTNKMFRRKKNLLKSYSKVCIWSYGTEAVKYGRDEG